MAERSSILFVIGSLNAGGAEKSLTSLLNSFPVDRYNIDLMLLRKEGLFLPLVPDKVNVIEAPVELQILTRKPSELGFYKKLPVKYWFKKVFRVLRAKYNKGKLNLLQLLWNSWKNDIPEFYKKYDVAVSYMDGTTNYFVIDKVKATRKYLWVHSDYNTMICDREMDGRYFAAADAVVTISPLCRDSLVREFPQLDDKFKSLENISNPDFILSLADSPIDNPVFNDSTVPRIVSVGRMTSEKGYLLSIEAARKLVSRGVNFNWFIIGDGPQRPELEARIQEYSLQNHIHLLGLQSNPYYFLRRSNLFVQASSYEGKSIAIDEAKIMRLPIVVTDFATVHDAITSGCNGLIVKQTASSLADGIMTCLNDENLSARFRKALDEENVNNVAVVSDYLKLFEMI